MSDDPKANARRLEGQDASSESDQVQVRRGKLRAWADRGVSPYGQPFDPTHRTAEINSDFSTLEGQEVRIAGRLVGVREHGKATFADLQDESGRLQLFVRQHRLGDGAYADFGRLDLGDIVGLTGIVMKTRAGEVSVEVTAFSLLSKALRPLPEKWHGLRDIELRYRKRYLDLIVNPTVRRTFELRGRVLRALRNSLNGQGYLEVETPVLHPVPGGANARPFVTFHNALDAQLFLRIAPELYLKRLLVGGYERLYELGKVFRNEGVSTKHNPEYTLLEAYEAYAGYERMMELTEVLVAEAAQAGIGSLSATFQGKPIDLTPPWPRRTMLDVVEAHTGVRLHDVIDAEEARRLAAKAGLEDLPQEASTGEVLNELFERKVESKLVRPVFITEYPVEISPLAKRFPDRPAFTERFELYINGWEIANGFSELNDPDDQRSRFQEQDARRGAGDENAHRIDLAYLEALEYGMPPAGGLGIGVDRLCMILADQPSIRDVLLFPHMRPIEQTPGHANDRSE